jgi:hypothetical protein
MCLGRIETDADIPLAMIPPSGGKRLPVVQIQVLPVLYQRFNRA